MISTQESAAQQTKRNSIENMYPLSPMQEGLLFHTLLSPTAGTYVPQIVLSLASLEDNKRIEGSLLEQAWEEAIARHSILRTGFYWEQREQPFQVVYRQSAMIQKKEFWIEQDWQHLSAAEQAAKLEILLACNRNEPFNLNQPPLMRLIWVCLGDNRYYLIWCYHHLILDGWSASQLLKEVFQQYFILAGTISPATKPTLHAYSDYIAWLNKQNITAAQSFWKAYLKGWNGPTPLSILSSQPLNPTVKLTAGSPQNQLAEQQRPISAKKTQQIKAFAKTQKITLNTVIQAALGFVLSRYCDEKDIVFGATCAGRPTELAGALSMVGLFINTLPVRVQIERQSTVAEWLQSFSAQQSTTTDYEYVSLRELQTWVGQGIGQGQSLFDCLLVFESYPVSAELFNNQSALRLEDIQFNEWTHFPLTILVSGEEQITFMAKYRSDRLSSEAVSRFLGHLNTAIMAFAKDSEHELKDISLLCSAEKKQLADWNKTAVEDYPLSQTLPDLFEAQVEKTPEVIALIFQDQSLSYQALNQQANQLAHHLQSLGIGPEQRVAVRLDRSFEMAIALLAIIKTGAAYVPLDPSYPEDRLSYMLADANVSATISEQSFNSSVEQLSTQNPQRTLHPQNSVYVIYTSGSTGQPKGVINTHQGLVNRLCWMQQTYSLKTGDRVLHKTPLSFDVSVWEIFWPLLNGATLVIAKPNGHKDSAYLADLIQAQNISVLHFVPSMLTAFLEAPEISNCRTLQHVICSGETLPVSLQEQFLQQFPTTALHNLYGPTEAAIDVTAWQCQPGSTSILIGRPIANTQIHLLDDDLNPVPIGVPGELYISGTGVARGYHNRPALTAEKFIPNSFIASKDTTAKGKYIYKTGDLARYRSDGTIEYLGRQDSQVKLRGVRIELGEIEAALNGHDSVRQAAVILREDLPGGRALVAYVVGELEAVTDIGRFLSHHLRAKLPDVMIPSIFVVLKSLPLTPNGKLNRRALPKPEQFRQIEKIAPRNSTEQAIAAIWSAVLQREDISINDNFFDLGSHSLTATRVNTRLRKHFSIALPLQSAFEYPTLESLATYIDALRIAITDNSSQPVGHKKINQRSETAQSALTITSAQRPANIPLSFAQQRLWFLHQMQPNSAVYNLPMAIRVEGFLETDALAQSLNHIVHRHEALRTRFVMVAGQPVQTIEETRPLDIEQRDLQDSLEPAEAVRRAAIEAAQKPFDLSQDQLLRVTLLKLGKTTSVVLFTVHHIVADAWSQDILIQELATFYKAALMGQTATLPPLPMQYADFSIWQQNWLQGETLEKQLDYWRSQLDTNQSVLQLPTDYARSRVQTYRGAVEQFSLTKELSQQLKTLGQQKSATLFITLLSAFKVLLYRYTGQTDLVVGTPIANRHRAEVEGLIGLFVNTLVLRSHLTPQSNFKTFLDQIKATTWAAYDHQDLPFEKLVEALQPERDLSYSPLFQVKFRLENSPSKTLNVPGLSFQRLPQSVVTAKLDLSVDLYETADGIVGGFEYNSDLFKPETIQRMIGHFKMLLASIAAKPESPIAELAMLTETEQQQIVQWNNTQKPYRQDCCFHHLFEEKVAQYPEAIALIFDNGIAFEQLTYTELNQRSNQLAHHLQSLGVGPETIVGICVERSPHMIIALLAVLKAGGAYLPLDSSYPPERLAYMLNDAQVPILLTQSHLPLTTAAQRLNLDTDWPNNQSQTNPTSTVKSDNLAYLIYTSGSTGKPKGVLVPHSGLVNLTEDKIRVCDVRSGDCILQFFSFSFDASIPEIIMALASGSKLLLAPATTLLPGPDLSDLIERHRVTHITLTPSALTSVPYRDFPHLRMALVGGEVPAPALVKTWSQNRIFINAYGPTETTVNASMVPCGNDHFVEPTLKPSTNKQLYVLDNNLQQLPIGVVGELHIGGVGIARGYLNRPKLTAERFIPNPFTKGSDVIYKTGDLATYLPDGRIKVLGRIDTQTKIRGFRIELGEVDRILQSHPQMKATFVAVREDTPGDKRLVAYGVPLAAVNEAQATPAEIRQFVAETLPQYMVPSIFMWLPALPLTPNGKVDPKSLPAPVVVSSQPKVAPSSDVEKSLAQIFSQVLSLESVGIYDDFFELGGHSLLATQLVAQSLSEFDVEITVVDLFEAATVAALAQRIEQKQRLAQMQQPVENDEEREEIAL